MTMKVRELVQWLQDFPDQEAEVEVIQQSRGTGYYEQGCVFEVVPFDPVRHADYANFRNNPFVEPTSPYFNKSKLLLGEKDAL